MSALRRQQRADKAAADQPMRGPDEISNQEQGQGRGQAPPAPDISELVAAELDRRARADADAAAAAAFAMGRCPSGACGCCGIESVVAVDDQGRRSPGWHADPDSNGHVCELCWSDLYDDAWFATRDDRRVGAIRMLLDGPPIPLVALGNPGAFAGVKVWHREFPGAPPVQAREDRWRHVDRVELAKQWQVIGYPHVDPPADLKPRTTPCPRCGVCRWRADFTVGRFFERCAACGGESDEHPAPAVEPYVREAGRYLPGGRWSGSPEADDTAAALLAVRDPAYGEPVIPGLAKRAGFKWFYETRGDRQGRRGPSAEPWAHLNLERMRRRAGLNQAVG